jgi:phosphate-selective porin OprO/OprP
MKTNLLAATLFGVSLMTFQPNLAHATSADDIGQRIQKLEEEIALLKRKQEVQDEKDKAAAEKAANIEFGKRGLKITSPDKKYEISLRGNFQFDSRSFLNDENNTGRDDLLARRLRPILEAKAGNASFRLMPDFAGSTTRIFDAHADYKLLDALQFRIGKFKTPVSLERLQSPADMFFIERGHPSNLAPSRDFGFMAYGNLVPDILEYQLGVFGGNQDLGNTDSDEDDSKDIAGRIFAHPFRNSDIVALQGLGVGIAGSVGEREGSSSKPILGTYKSPGQQDFFRYRSNTFADGQHWRLYPQAYWYSGNTGLLAEYAISNQEVTRGADQAELQHSAWQLAGSYVLTGEDVNFRGGIKPNEDFDLGDGGIGAWEITARIGQTDVDDETFINFADSNVAASKATSYGGGLNWYLSENLKLIGNYDFTQFDGGETEGKDRPDEHALFARTQFRF